MFLNTYFQKICCFWFLYMYRSSSLWNSMTMAVCHYGKVTLTVNTFKGIVHQKQKILSLLMAWIWLDFWMRLVLVAILRFFRITLSFHSFVGYQISDDFRTHISSIMCLPAVRHMFMCEFVVIGTTWKTGSVWSSVVYSMMSNYSL